LATRALISDWKSSRRSRRAGGAGLDISRGISSLDTSLGAWAAGGVTASRDLMSERAASGGQTVPDYSEKSKSPSAAGRSATGSKRAVQTPREHPPAVLIFQDGRREEVSEYTIMSGMIYSKADYWTTGSWTRKIQIADLDVPATLRLNQERGVKFVLPASPNEVVVRP